LELGICDLFGIWDLGFGAFLHLGRCGQDGLDNMLIAGAPAHVPGKTHSDFFFGGIGVSLQQFTGAQEKTGSAESTL